MIIFVQVSATIHCHIVAVQRRFGFVCCVLCSDRCVITVFGVGLNKHNENNTFRQHKYDVGVKCRNVCRRHRTFEHCLGMFCNKGGGVGLSRGYSVRDR
jgi:hypothetical protein